MQGFQAGVLASLYTQRLQLGEEYFLVGFRLSGASAVTDSQGTLLDQGGDEVVGLELSPPLYLYLFAQGQESAIWQVQRVSTVVGDLGHDQIPSPYLTRFG
ncbi:hypothetical protein D3C81_1922740 [compost metagenome]